MRRDTHLAALKMASKVAFGVSIIGCGQSEEAPPPAPQRPPATCREILNAAFPEPDNYPGKKTSSVEALRCCDELLTKEQPGGHRWDCCANVDQTKRNLPTACTPWGPPVPPPMQARTRRTRTIAAA